MSLVWLIALLVAALVSWPMIIVAWSLPGQIFDRQWAFKASRKGLVLVAPLPLLATLWAAAELSPIGLPGGLVLSWTLICLSVVDTRTRILPNCLTLPLIVAGLVNKAAVVTTFSSIAMAGPATLQYALAGGLGYIALASIALAYRAWRKSEGLGMGDAKLFAAAGAWLGFGALPSVLLVASVAALVVTLSQACILNSWRVDKAARIPFGPYLAVGIWLVFLYGPLAIR